MGNREFFTKFDLEVLNQSKLRHGNGSLKNVKSALVQTDYRSMILPAMVRLLLLIAFGVVLSNSVETEASTNRLLVIERSFTRVSAAKATLTIDPLVRLGETFAGKYQMKVTPFFFKSETGNLEIFVTEESMAKVRKGEAVEITGTALTDGENVKRKVNAKATPAGENHGDLKVWFVVDDNKMVFETSYRLVER